jgi:light-regulated signal transduction histidine kinase (bacteriophytochrome)
MQLAIAIAQARLRERVKRYAEELELRVRERTQELRTAHADLQKTNTELVESTRDLQAANKELEAFSYSVSHDLRSPLRAIDGFSLMLQEDYAAALDDEGRRLLRVIQDSSGKMAQLIEDLLGFSRIVRAAISRIEIDMTALARDAISVLTQPEKAKHCAITLAVLPPAWGDSALLRQVWLNLIDNAIKYSSKRAQPRVEISSRVDDSHVVYCVQDNGSGFDMQYCAKLFGVFQRLHSAEEFPGTGVGLAIVQRVVTRHGGRVWAEGKLNEGAKFYFSLPKEAANG